MAVVPSPGVTRAEFLIRDHGRVRKWCDLWEMKLNARNTKTMIISRSRTMHRQSLPLTIDRTVLKESDYLDILEVTFDSKMSFEKHLRSVSRAASQRLGILRKSWRILRLDILRKSWRVLRLGILRKSWRVLRLCILRKSWRILTLNILRKFWRILRLVILRRSWWILRLGILRKSRRILRLSILRKSWQILRLGILRKFWQAFHDISLVREMLSGFCNARFGVLFRSVVLGSMLIQTLNYWTV